MSVVVATTGSACRTGFAVDASDRLGLQIVRTLVEAELGGIDRDPAAGPASRGAEAVLDVPLAGRR